MATYGEGDPTDNAHELHEWLQNDQDLEGVNYAVGILDFDIILVYFSFGDNLRGCSLVYWLI